MTMTWIMFPGCHPAALGYIPDFLSEDDPRPAREQMNTNYRPGWLPMPGVRFNADTCTMHYPGDPPFRPIAMAMLRDEKIVMVEHAFLVIVQADGSYEAARVD